MEFLEFSLLQFLQTNGYHFHNDCFTFIIALIAMGIVEISRNACSSTIMLLEFMRFGYPVYVVFFLILGNCGRRYINKNVYWQFIKSASPVWPISTIRYTFEKKDCP